MLPNGAPGKSAKLETNAQPKKKFANEFYTLNVFLLWNTKLLLQFGSNYFA